MAPVLILAESSDIHALSVAAKIADAGGTPILFDSADYPEYWRINFSYSDAGSEVYLRSTPPEGTSLAPLVGSQGVCLADLSGVWYRRIEPFKIPAAVGDPQVRAFAANECRDAFFAMLEMAPNIINNPARESVANRKPYQHAKAAAAGLHTPETLITNDPEEVERFWQRLGGEVVFKILTNTRTQFTETRVLTEREMTQISAARYAPTIFQRKLEASYHLRVTIIDDDIFAAKLTTTRPEARYDWRLDHRVKIEATQLPAALDAQIHAFMAAIGLRFGALDFIVTGDGEAWFLEVNPSGQFLFVELATEQPISDTLAHALMRR